MLLDSINNNLIISLPTMLKKIILIFLLTCQINTIQKLFCKLKL